MSKTNESQIFDSITASFELYHDSGRPSIILAGNVLDQFVGYKFVYTYTNANNKRSCVFYVFLLPKTKTIYLLNHTSILFVAEKKKWGWNLKGTFAK